MKRKIIFLTMLASISVSCISASAVTYRDARMMPSSNNNMQPSPVVMNYNPNNQNSPQNTPQDNNINNGPSLFSSTHPSTPNSITSANVSPTTTNYGQNTGMSYDLNIGSIYGTPEQRGSLVSCIKNMPLTKIGIGRTVSELTSLYTNGSDDSNYWSYDSNSTDNIIFRCGNYIIKFKTYAASYGIDVYAQVYCGGQLSMTEAQISDFFAKLSKELYEKEQKEKEEQEKAQSSTAYNNSVVINGTNSGTVVLNNYN